MAKEYLRFFISLWKTKISTAMDAYFREIKSLVVDIFYSDGWAHGGRNKDTLNVLTLDRSWLH